MRLGITGKAEQEFLSLLNQSGVNNPTHLMNLLVSFISLNPEEAIIYARDYNKKQKEA